MIDNVFSHRCRTCRHARAWKHCSAVVNRHLRRVKIDVLCKTTNETRSLFEAL